MITANSHDRFCKIGSKKRTQMGMTAVSRETNSKRVWTSGADSYCLSRHFFRAEFSRMLFDHCAVCRQCCTIEEGYPPLEITLTAREEKRFGSLCIKTDCTNLGPQGCTLGDEKPFSCSLYPLSYDPESDGFSFDRDCPLKETYFAQLDDPESDASRHLSEMSGQIEKLKKTDPKFLFTNRSVDVDYFDLQELPSYKR
jgi:hypothetical protein